MLCCMSGLAAGAANLNGQTGLINMPDGRLEADGTFRSGFYFARPYSGIQAGVTLLPFLEASGRFNRFMGVPTQFTEAQGNDYGDNKDKVFDLKLRLLSEGPWWPALAVGANDVIGTELFRSQYVAASKRLGPLDVTVGAARGVIDGAFGGARLDVPWVPGLRLVAEYDANDYRKHAYAVQSGIATKEKGGAAGVEYEWGWLTTQLSYQRDEPAFLTYVSVPLEERSYVPKFDEPEPDVRIVPRPSAAQWKAESKHRRDVVNALLAQDFRNVQVSYADGTLRAVLTNSRISTVPRAIGRATRILVARAPLETQAIEVTYTLRDLPVVTYRFADLEALQNYFVGNVPKRKLAEKVEIRPAGPMDAEAAGSAEEDRMAAEEALEAAASTSVPFGLRFSDEGVPVTLRSEDAFQNRMNIRPSADIFFNDPSGIFHYGIHLLGSVERRVSSGWWLSGSVRLTVLEDVSEVTQPSNSRLPHVRTDVAEYYRATKFRLNNLMLNRYFQMSDHDYGRVSAGIYEDMFAGAGGQWLHLFEKSNFAADVAVDWLRQRDFEGWFGFRDYRTVTALGSLHWQLPKGMKMTLRGGRFLAKDRGVRAEVKRRFLSGVELGAWYTVTNGKDETPPGRPGSPYFDKGIFFSMPFAPFLTLDTQGGRGMSVSPWTRDVGQMVRSPGDLYSLMEKARYHDMRVADGLSEFGDVDDDPRLPSLGTSIYDRPLVGGGQ